METRAVAVLNAGSSSLKFTIFDGTTVRLKGMVDRIGVAGAKPHVKVSTAEGATLLDEDLNAERFGDVLDWLLDWPPFAGGSNRPTAIGHRVVHGGDRFTAPVRLTPDVIRELDALSSLAPLHNPHNVLPMRHIQDRDPNFPQVACFDTAFHATQDRLERMFGLPRRYYDEGIKRYGFHGLSYEFVSGELCRIDRRAAEGRAILCHLGNGASLCAILRGMSKATTMTYSPTDGLLMGTRSGSLDPSVVLHLIDQAKMSAQDVSDLLNKKSGLLGVSGISPDMRDLMESSAPEAREAVDLFCYRIAREAGALASVVGGLDALVFTGGIGENAAGVRVKVCQRLEWLGVELDQSANGRRGTLRINAEYSRVAVYVIATDEEQMIARHTLALV